METNDDKKYEDSKEPTKPVVGPPEQETPKPSTPTVEKEKEAPTNPATPTPQSAAIGPSTTPTGTKEVVDNYREKKASLMAEFNSNPDDYQTEPNGRPKFTAGGDLWRKPGRKAKARKDLNIPNQSGSGLNTPPPVEPSQDSQLPPSEESGGSAEGSKEAAMVATHSMFALGQVIFGVEGAPIKRRGYDEEQVTVYAWEKYFEAKGVTEVPPSMMVLGVVASYSAQRMAMEAPRKRVLGITGRIKQVFKHVFKRSKKAKAPIVEEVPQEKEEE